MMKQHSTSPRRQYVATAIFAILAIVTSMATLHQNNTTLDAHTMSVSDTPQGDNGHSETFEYMLEKKSK
jgi:hypothetical protein